MTAYGWNLAFIHERGIVDYFLNKVLLVLPASFESKWEGFWIFLSCRFSLEQQSFRIFVRFLAFRGLSRYGAVMTKMPYEIVFSLQLLLDCSFLTLVRFYGWVGATAFTGVTNESSPFFYWKASEIFFYIVQYYLFLYVVTVLVIVTWLISLINLTCSYESIRETSWEIEKLKILNLWKFRSCFSTGL